MVKTTKFMNEDYYDPYEIDDSDGYEISNEFFGSDDLRCEGLFGADWRMINEGFDGDIDSYQNWVANQT